MLIYGLDLSISSTGVSIINESQDIVYLGSVQTPSSWPIGKRLHKIRTFLKRLQEEYPPSVICIERGFSRFNHSTQVLYTTHGIALELFHEYECLYFPPNQVKKAVTGKGNANKKIVRDAIQGRYPEQKIKNFDESDAVGVALMYYYKDGEINGKKE